MPGLFAEYEIPPMIGSSVGQSIWSNGTDQQPSSNRPSNVSSMMQQLAYELSMFGIGQQQQRQQDTGSVSGSYSSDSAVYIHDLCANNGDLSLLDDGQLARRRSQNTTECVPVPSSEHVAEIVGRQGCKIKALRAKTNTYIKTPVRGEDPVFVVTGRHDDVEAAKKEIMSAAEHFTQIRASRRHSQGGAPAPGQVTAYVRVPYKVVGLVVGPKGATIKRIQQQTHTYIITPSREKDPIFEVTGLPDNVETARKEIETHIANRTGVYPATTVDTPPTCSDDESVVVPQPLTAVTTLINDFHLNGVDTSFGDATKNGNTGRLSDSDEAMQAPYFSSSSRSSASSFLSMSDQRRSSADSYMFGDAANRAIDSESFNTWCAFIGGAIGNGLSANESKATAKLYRTHKDHSNSGSDQDEGVWSVGGDGDSSNNLSVEPLVSSCLASIWSEVVGV